MVITQSVMSLLSRAAKSALRALRRSSPETHHFIQMIPINVDEDDTFSGEVALSQIDSFEKWSGTDKHDCHVIYGVQPDKYIFLVTYSGLDDDSLTLRSFLDEIEWSACMGGRGATMEGQSFHKQCRWVIKKDDKEF